MLTSLQNPLVKEIRKLHSPKGRRERGLFLLEGSHLLEAAESVQFPLTTVCYTSSWQEKNQKLWQKLYKITAQMVLVSEAVLSSLATTVQPDGIIATAQRQNSPSFTINHLGLVLEKIQDPGNLGTIIRTATAANVDGLWLTHDSVELDHPKVLRASAGAWFHLPMTIKDNLIRELQKCQSQGVQILATVPNASLSYWEVDFSHPTLILLGNEGNGLSTELVNLANQQVKIPLNRGIESLNVAITAALIVYEAQRQRTL